MKKNNNEYDLPEPIVNDTGNFRVITQQAYSTGKVARLLSIPVEELIRMRDENCGPKYDVIKGKTEDLVMYSVSNLTDWLRERDGIAPAEQDTPDKL
jgi:hypothetical protein